MQTGSISILNTRKKDYRNESVGMYRSNHQHFCPVLLWAKIVTRFRSYKGTDPHTKRQVNTFIDKKRKWSTKTSAGIQKKLRSVVQILGKGKLGFRPMEI